MEGCEVTACPACEREVIPPDFRRGRLGLCFECDEKEYVKRSAGYERDRARSMRRHPTSRGRGIPWPIVERSCFGSRCDCLRGENVP